jgi:activator of 2-hydroxyglutaryl-CoA dehydratase
VIVLTGGLALDEGLVAALGAETKAALRAPGQALFAGAIGAALLGAMRQQQLDERARAS